jgi:hypothetical protein
VGVAKSCRAGVDECELVTPMMDEWTRECLAQAIALDDEALAACTPEPPEPLKRAAPEVIYKRHDPQPEANATMDDAEWRARFDRSFMNHPLVKHIETVMNRSDDELYENDLKLKRKIEQLEAEIGALRVEIRAHKPNTLSGSVTPIIRSARDVA